MQTIRGLWHALVSVDDITGSVLRVAVLTFAATSTVLLVPYWFYQTAENAFISTFVDGYILIPISIVFFTLYRVHAQRVEQNQARAAVFFCLGLLAWSLANLYYLVLQYWVVHDTVQAPPYTYLYDFVFLGLPAFWLAGQAFQRRAAPGETAAETPQARPLRSGMVVGGIFVLTLLTTLRIYDWRVASLMDAFYLLVNLAYAVLDPLVLLGCWDRVRAAPRNPGGWFNLAGWSLFTGLDYALVIGYNLPEEHPLAYFDGSLYDLLGLLAVSCLSIGLTYLVADRRLSVPAGSQGQPRPFAELTPGEQYFVRALVQGKTIKEISYELGRSRDTVERRLKQMCGKYGFENRFDLAMHYKEEVEGRPGPPG